MRDKSHPDVETLQRLADALGVELMALPRLYGSRAATAVLFFLLGALLWLTQPDTGP